MDRPPAMFIADSLGLDFLNSVATPVDTPVDWLGDGDGLIDWMAQAKLVPAAELDALKARARPGELDKVAGEARALREWFRGFVREHAGQPLGPAALQELGPLNNLLAQDEMFSRIEPRSDDSHHGLALRTTRRGAYFRRNCPSQPSRLCPGGDSQMRPDRLGFPQS